MGDQVAVVKPQQPQAEPSFFARIVGDEGTARIVESISSWVNDKAKENPGCVEHFVCEMYKTGETMSGLPYLVMSLTNAAVSFMVAEQFSDSIQMDARCSMESSGRSLTGWLGLRSCWVMWSTLCQLLSARSPPTPGPAHCLPNINQLKLYCIRNATFFHVIIILISI